MTFYDELGLRPDASPDEIRRAYRNLARLLHPDQQADEALRRQRLVLSFFSLVACIT